MPKRAPSRRPAAAKTSQSSPRRGTTAKTSTGDRPRTARPKSKSATKGAAQSKSKALRGAEAPVLPTPQTELRRRTSRPTSARSRLAQASAPLPAAQTGRAGPKTAAVTKSKPRRSKASSAKLAQSPARPAKRAQARSSSAAATAGGRAAPANGGSKAASAPRLELPIERFELSCGATLLVSHRPGAPITAAQVHIRGGIALDPAGLDGVAFLTGALAPEGTSQHTEEQLADLLEPEGGGLSGDSTGLAGSIVSGSWELLLDLLGELLLSPAYPLEKVERQRDRLLQRLQVERDDHRVQAGQLFRRLIYGQHWLGRSERGTVESIAQIRRDDLVSHHARHWVAKRAVIAVCGNVTGAEVRAFLERRLSSWKGGDAIELPTPQLPTLEARTAGFRAERQQVQVCLGHLGIKRKDEDYVAALVMDHVLGTGPGFTDRISRRLRDEEGLAYSVQANLHGTAGVQPGMFLASIGTSPDKLAQALKGFIEEIHRIRREPVEPAELQLAIQYLTGSFVLGFERAARRAQYMVQAHRYGLPHDDLATLPGRIASVTAEEILNVARQRLHPEALCLSIGGPVVPSELPAILARAQAEAVAVPAKRAKARRRG